jgi:hypothetical protein
MKSYRVYKNLNKQPYILGLRLPLFYLFTVFLIILIFLLSAGITGLKLAVFTAILSVGYFVLKGFNSGTFLSSITNDRFPDTIINDNYK